MVYVSLSISQSCVGVLDMRRWMNMRIGWLQMRYSGSTGQLDAYGESNA